MGYDDWNKAAYANYASTAAPKARHKVFHRISAMSAVRSGQEVNAEKIGYRESRDSVNHPNATPVMVGLDVTGSMGAIPELMVKGGLGTFVNQILERQPITDPHILFMGIGDATMHDTAPLQVTQFEADNKICAQLEDIYLEGGGGGNQFESYDLAWAFAAYRTKTDAWEKRKGKGFLFTVGDECFPKETSKSYLRSIFGNDCPQDPTPESLLESAQLKYHVFHVIVAEGSFAERFSANVLGSWRERLQRRALVLTDHTRVAEVLVSAIALESGEPLEDVLAWWDQNTAAIVRRAMEA